MPEGKVMFIDDEADSRDNFADLISKQIDYEVEAIEPPQLSEISNIVRDKPRLIIIDYQLTRKRSDESVAFYHMDSLHQGGALLSMLREATKEIPLAIITRPGIYEEYPQIRHLADIADLILLKEQLSKPEYGVGRKLKGLIRGYEQINKISKEKRNWSSLLGLLGATSAEESILDETNPPIGPDDSIRSEETDLAMDDIQNTVKHTGWTAHDASKWVIGTLFSYPGILYDFRHSAVSLGVEPDFFLHKVQYSFKDAKYNGAFKEYNDYWWRAKLRSTAIAAVGVDEVSPINEAFPSWFEKRHKTKVIRAKCIWSGQMADGICYILKEPIKTDFSLLYYPDNRPSIMDQARVSFEAIRYGNRAKIRLIRKTDIKLFNDIKAGKLDDLRVGASPDVSE